MGTIDERTLEKTRSRALKNALKGDYLSDMCSEAAPTYCSLKHDREFRGLVRNLLKSGRE